MNKNKKNHILKIIVTLFIILLLVFIYLFLYSKIKFLSAQIGDAKSLVLALEEKRHGLDTAKTVVEDFKEEIQIIENAFLSEENFINFVGSLEDFENKSGAEFTAKEANFPANKSGYVEFSFSLKGGGENIFRFLFLLDNSQYSGTLRKISFRRENEGSKNFIADVHYSIFNFKP